MMEQEIINYAIKSQENLKKIIVNYMQNFANSVDNVDGNISTILTFSNNLKTSLNICNDNLSSLKDLSNNIDDSSYKNVLSRVMENTLSIEDNLCSISEKSGLVSNVSVNSQSVKNENYTTVTEPVTTTETETAIEPVTVIETETKLETEPTPVVESTTTQTVPENSIAENIEMKPSLSDSLQEEKQNVESVTESNSENDNVENNEDFKENTLIVSEMSGNVTLPYSLSNLQRTLEHESDKYSSLQDIISKKYTLPIKAFKNPFISRFKEAFKLMRKKEGGTVGEAISLGTELMFNYNLHPAIITACKNLDELDIYLDYLESGETQKFNCFKIVFELPPTLSKNTV